MQKKYIVRLTDKERARLLQIVEKKQASIRKVIRAHILLQAAEGVKDVEIAESLQIGLATVKRIRRRFIQGNLEYALNENPRPGAKQILDKSSTELLLTLAGSEPPAGRRRWTLQLLADRLVELDRAPSISDETVRRVLEKCGAQRG